MKVLNGAQSITFSYVFKGQIVCFGGSISVSLIAIGYAVEHRILSDNIIYQTSKNLH
jgi:hypothetical protein